VTATDPQPEALVRLALDGDRAAVGRLATVIQDDVYGLAVRTLWVRRDAEDATQEILVRVVTRLSQFDFRSAFRTWVYRVAVNYLLDARKSAVERLHLSFQQFGEDLEEGLSTDGPADAERSTLVEEVKVGCTLAMLQCLDRPHRIAYVLGELLELSAVDAALALDIDPAAFRKRLERSRRRIETFVRERCGLVADEAACRCNRRVPVALQLGRVRTDQSDFASGAVSFDDVRSMVRRVEVARRALEVHRSSRPRPADVDFARRVVAAMSSGS
jgi:RNA polymerase sigma factor (sigma-70 family)